jgi:bifunctional non-homologous end joining protein LigD
MPSLTTYQKKRDFGRTPEPSGDGQVAPSGERRFVIQRHRARRTHYDFRLEIDGVLVSWAVPKGLTLDPKARHLAVRVEDHPLAYIDFEGVIPKGEYGAGDVIVWDRGTWDLDVDADPERALARGELHLDLFGSKLRGRFVLVRTKTDRAGKEQWLVLHKRDPYAETGWDPDDHPRSVISGRTNDDVAADPDRLWTRAGEHVVQGSVRFDAPTPDELDELDELPAKGRWAFQGRALALTNLDKVLFPGRADEPPVTKRELIRYYACVAPVLLPYLLDRPLNLHRYPDGVERKGFWQKEAPRHAPDWIPRWHNEEADPDESQHYLVPDSPPALAWLANHAAVELHAWTSRLPDVHHPAYALIDVDPGEDTTWDELVTMVELHRTALEHLRVRGYPKLSGRRGVQVWIPIAPGPSFDETRAWVEQLSRTIGKVVPDLVSWSWEKRSRGGKARLDYTQNAINKTLVAPYSVRAAAGAPVSVPVGWDEIGDPELRSDRWTVRTVLDRIGRSGDPMAPALRDAQELPSLT